MKAKHQIAAALTAVLAVSGVSMAAKGPLVSTQSSVSSQRSELVRAFVLKWGSYVQTTYKVPVGVWAKRMVPNFASADIGNLREALKRTTFEGAMAQLSGTGNRISDTQVLDRIARMPVASQGKAIAAKFGDLSADLVYTPLVPCRVVDTRLTADGQIAADGSRSFVATNQADFTAQGGAASNCGTSGLNASAVVINVTAVRPSGAGYATVYPYNETKPLAASVNYSAGEIINNGIVAKIPNPVNVADFTIYTYAGSHYVVDVVGYFAPPQATALDCTSTTVSSPIAGGATFNLNLPACPTGYKMTGAGCKVPGFNQVNWSSTGLVNGGNAPSATCQGINITSGNVVVQGDAQCCRVPGR